MNNSSVSEYVDPLIRENKHLKDILYHSGIVEIASHNSSVYEYMVHWEGRVLDAELEIMRLKTALKTITSPKVCSSSEEARICASNALGKNND